MKKKLNLILVILIMAFFVPALNAAPTINGVMEYDDPSDWGSLGNDNISIISGNFNAGSALKNVIVEEGNTNGDEYDVEELGLYINENILYIGIQTQYDISSDPATRNIDPGDFIFMLGSNSDSSFNDYNTASATQSGVYDFAIDLTFDANDNLDITLLAGTLSGTGVGSYENNFYTDWEINQATATADHIATSVTNPDLLKEYAFSTVNSGSEWNEKEGRNYYNGRYTLEMAIDLNELSGELSTLFSTFDTNNDSVAMFWQPSCGNDFLAVRSDFAYTSEIPEPSTMILFGMGLLGAGAIGRRRQRKN